jgi:hypothetical protein
MIISILLFQQRRIRQLERELQAIKPDTPPPSESQQTMRADQAQPKTSIPTATKGGEQLRLEVSKR